MVSFLQRAWELPPRESVRKVVRRLRGRSGFELNDLLRSPKHMQSQLFYNFLSRYETILARTHNWRPFDFAGRNVLEVGCGPVLGFGPLALFLGAASYTAVDPAFRPELALHPQVRDKYYLNVFKDLSAIFGPRMDYERWLDALRTRVRVAPATILAADYGGRTFDIMLSNSTVEHIEPLDASIARLRQVASPDARFLHLVDFGNHRPTRNPFAGMYSVEPDEYRKKHGRGINLARAPEVLRTFREAGFTVAMEPYYSYREFYDEQIAPYWRRYSEHELFLKCALVFSA